MYIILIDYWVQQFNTAQQGSEAPKFQRLPPGYVPVYIDEWPTSTTPEQYSSRVCCRPAQRTILI
ncbi:hypothetical protein [Nodularia sp. UHCC 0506]|uniref:hypothetical protein n=1 Tax=Nodularia sp. UHCC 0506 TaxID=3110243 RepID=UPI002B2171D8|nr:hypothetical protein [Nodularia sp. UHCC 0506]MEA5512566.1 hypothetical protein [Nodularia sp. UHCC 0506]